MGDLVPSLELPPEAIKNHAMEKITDKIAALPAGQDYFSLEFFPPKTAMGFSNLRGRLDRMARALRPLFVNVTWGAGGSTATKSLELAEICQRELGLTTCLHLTCTNMSRRLIDKALDDAKALGIRNILALRGDPPRRAEYRDVNDPEPSDEEEEFCWAVDLVRYIRKTHGDYFCIGVAAYPEGHADESHPLGQSLEHDLPYLVEKTQAGADFMMTQLFFDSEAYRHFEETLRDHPSGAFKDIPIIPGLMPIQSYQMIKRTTKLSHAKIPDALMARLDAVKGDDEKVKQVGVDIVSEIIEQVREIKDRTSGPRGFHFYTLNLEKAVSFIVERTGLIAPSTPEEEESSTQNPLPDIRVLHINGSTPDQSSHEAHLQHQQQQQRKSSVIGSDPRDRVIVPGGRSPSYPDWEATALEASLPAAPINSRANTLAISEGEGVLGREATWDDFPNGRWGDARSPAYGQIDGYGVSLHVTVAQARQLWGSPVKERDVSEIFMRHLKGELNTIPWSEESFSPETEKIRERLVALNEKGWWTLASQPAVNGLRSGDPVFGWGPPNGFVFQKAFVEFFLPSRDWEVLLREKLAKEGEVVCWYATNAKGDFVSSDNTTLMTGQGQDQQQQLVQQQAQEEKEASTNAVTWGVFPGKEIVTPTIIEEVSFRAWSEEAFGIWGEWAKIYAKGSESERFLERLRGGFVAGECHSS